MSVTLEDVVNEKEILLRFESVNDNIREETEVTLKTKVKYRRSIVPVGSKGSGGPRKRTGRRFSETALTYLAEDYTSQLSNKEPKFLRSNASLANSCSELDVYGELNSYIDRESGVRRAQSTADLLGEVEEEEVSPRQRSFSIDEQPLLEGLPLVYHGIRAGVSRRQSSAESADSPGKGEAANPGKPGLLSRLQKSGSAVFHFHSRGSKKTTSQ